MGKREDNRQRGRGRRAAAALVVSAAALAAVVFIGPRLVPGPMLAGRVAEALTAATGAEVTVGQARLTLIGGPGLRVDNARLVRRGAYDVALERADVSLAVLPLVGKRLVVDGARASGASARATWRGQPVALADFTLKARGLNYELPRPSQAAVAAPPTDGPLLPPGLEGSVSVKLGHGDWTTFAVDDLDLEASLQERVITVRSLTCRTAGGTVSATGTWDPTAAAAAAVEGAVRLDGVEAAALLRPWAPDVATQLEARVSGEVKLACTLGDAATIRSTLSGEGNLRAGEGMLRTGPWLSDAKQYLGDRQDLIDIRFTELRHVFRVAGGTFAVDTLALRGPDTDWDLGGTLGFDGATDLAVHVCLPPDFVPELGSMTMYALALRDAERQVNLDITVQGPLADPVVGLDFAAMAKRLVKPRSSTG